MDEEDETIAIVGGDGIKQLVVARSANKDRRGRLRSLYWRQSKDDKLIEQRDAFSRVLKWWRALFERS